MCDVKLSLFMFYRGLKVGQLNMSSVFQKNSSPVKLQLFVRILTSSEEGITLFSQRGTRLLC